VTRIGITSSIPRDAGGAVHEDVLPYVHAVERAGGLPVLLENDLHDVDELLSTLGGVVFTGGVDVDPVRYGGRSQHSNKAKAYRAERDDFELALVRATRELAVPTLCVCRGLQVANVAFGGTLIEDVRDELGSRYTIEHRQVHESGLDRSDYAPGHDVAIEPDSALARILGTPELVTNSMHHQALRAVAAAFRVVARTPDGVVEGVDAAFEHPFFVAVQWHPEELDDEPNRRLFTALVAAAAARVTATK
jgi:putative glutamine amidotransferase